MKTLTRDDTIHGVEYVPAEDCEAAIAKLNERLIERQTTLIEKGVECEEMRKELERAKAELRTANELLNDQALAQPGRNQTPTP